MEKRREADSSSKQLGFFDLPSSTADADTSLPRTCRDYLARPAEPISLRSLANCLGLTYEFQLAVGKTPAFAETFDPMSLALRGGCVTLDFGESHRDAVECSLSETLVATGDVAPSYYLSRRACAGILRRAQKRGRSLPPLLLAALEQGAAQTTTPHKQTTS